MARDVLKGLARPQGRGLCLARPLGAASVSPDPEDAVSISPDLEDAGSVSPDLEVEEGSRTVSDVSVLFCLILVRTLTGVSVQHDIRRDGVERRDWQMTPMHGASYE